MDKKETEEVKLLKEINSNLSSIRSNTSDLGNIKSNTSDIGCLAILLFFIILILSHSCTKIENIERQLDNQKIEMKK